MITLDQVLEVDPHKFVAEASDLDLPVGIFPPQIPTTLGNRQPFLISATEKDRDGDTKWVSYRQAFGCTTLRIFND